MTNDVLDRIKAIHRDDFDYTHFEFKGMHKKVTLICKKHGKFTPTPQNLLKGCKCRKCGAESRAEKKIIESANAFKDKAIKVHNGFYSYDKFIYVSSTIKSIITCPIHGDFKQLPTDHLLGHGCRQCAIDKSSIKYSSNTNDFIKKATKLHGEYNYSLVDYKNSKQHVTIVCTKHGEFTQKPNDHLMGCGCPACGSQRSSGEMELNDFIKEHAQTIVRDRTLINPKEIDIYLPEHKIAIEYHGLYWHSEANRDDAKTIHQLKHKLCKEKGIRLIQIWEDEWENKQRLIKSMLLAAIGKTKKIHARKCTIEYISTKTAKDFFNANHLNGYRPSTYYIGLTYNNKLVMAMSIGAISVSINKSGLEITRMATLLGYQVIGGLSKILSYVDTYIPYSELHTYADAMWYSGVGYLKAGFTGLGLSSPGYYYTFQYGMRRFHRYQFAKHKLKDKLESFDESLSEVQNMHNNGYVRLWDAGHYRFIKKGRH